MKPSFLVVRDFALHHSPSLKSRNNISSHRRGNGKLIFGSYCAESFARARERSIFPLSSSPLRSHRLRGISDWLLLPSPTNSSTCICIFTREGALLPFTSSCYEKRIKTLQRELDEPKGKLQHNVYCHTYSSITFNFSPFLKDKSSS